MFNLCVSICDATFYILERSERTFFADRITNFVTFFRDIYYYNIFAFKISCYLCSIPMSLRNSIVTIDGKLRCRENG